MEFLTIVDTKIKLRCVFQCFFIGGCIGAPDLIIEILSPGNSRTEMKDKFKLYEEAGVLEYWVVSPIEKNVLVWKLNEAGKFIGLQPKVEGNILTTSVVPNLTLKLNEIFEQD